MSTSRNADPDHGQVTAPVRPVILLVDDTPQYLTALGSMLAPTYTVRVANSGPRAIALAGIDPKPDLILLDVMMPDMDGYAVLKALRGDALTSGIPVIFVTGKDSPGDEQHGLDMGAADYIAKPFSPAVALARVNTHIALKRARDDLQRQNLHLIAEVEERRRSEANVQSLNEALQRSMRDLEAFSYTVSHDLRGPLRRMSGFAQLLLMDVETGKFDETRSHVDRICAAVEKMDQLIEGLLSVAKIARSDLKLQTVDMNDLVASVIREVPGSEHARFKVGPLPSVHCDETTMHQVWTNLISNALKYSAKKAQPEIDVSCEAGEKEVVFSVRDNGAGFNPASTDRLFTVFSRLHNSGEFEGTGVGLAIVRSIVELHGGRVWAKGVPGEGAHFFFALPASTREGSVGAP
jgi:signal transduction histidine kinase